MSESALPLPDNVPPAPAPPPVARVSAVAHRVLVVDAFRGVALVLMALDHTAYYNSVNILAEHYEGLTSHLPETIYRLLGLITNLSAPTFWLVSGISIALLSGGTRGSKGLEWKVTRYLWVRSLALLVLDATVVPLLWNKHFIPHYQYHFDLLSSFAVSMLLLSVLRFLPWPLMLSICLGI